MGYSSRKSISPRRLLLATGFMAAITLPAGVIFAAPSPSAISPSTSPPRMTIPNRDAQAKSEKVIRDVFGNYPAAAAKERGAIAIKMVAQAQATGDDPAARYVLLKDAADLAAGAGDASTAMQAVELMAQSYAVDAVDLKIELLRKAAFVSSDPDSLSAVVDVGLNSANDATSAGNYDLAMRYMAPAEAAARNARDLELLATVLARSNEIRWMQQESLRSRSAEQRLATNPEDADANLLVGRFLCLVRNNWRDGLPRIARGSNPAFRAAAIIDLANPAEFEKQVIAGDFWWALGEKEPTSPQAALRRRAALWYSRALTDARFTGLSRARVEKRVSQAPASVPEEAGAPASPATSPATIPASIPSANRTVPATPKPRVNPKPALPSAPASNAPRPAYPVPPALVPATTPAPPATPPAGDGNSIFSEPAKPPAK